MPNKFLYQLADFHSRPTTEIGVHARMFATLSENGIPVPKMLCIPIETLKLIAHANNLQAQLYAVVSSSEFNNESLKKKTADKIRKLISKQSIPHELALSFVQLYERYLEAGFVLVKNSQPVRNTTLESDNCVGEATVSESVLDIWAQLSVIEFMKLPSKNAPLTQVLFPSPLLLIQQQEADISGIGYSFDTTNGAKNCITLLSNWGVFAPSNQTYDRYTIDVRTQNVVHSSIAEKKNYYRRVLGKLRKESLVGPKQNQETLTLPQTQKLTKLISQVKQHHVSQIKVEWSITDNRICIENVCQTEWEPLDAHADTQANKSMCKVFTKVINASSLQKSGVYSDGICIFNSAQLLSVTGEHPMFVAQSKRRANLIRAVANTLIKYQQKINKLLLYKSNSGLSNNLIGLAYGDIYEPQENNPYLGFKGAQRILSQQTVFTMELEILHEVMKSTKQEVALVLPSVRSPDELRQMMKLLNTSGLLTQKLFSVWMELATIENIMNLHSYPFNSISGFTFNIESLSGLLSGYDPTVSENQQKYPKNTELLYTLIEKALDTIDQKNKGKNIYNRPKLLVDMTHFEQPLIEKILELPIEGIIVNAEVTAMTKQCIINAEQKIVWQK